MAYYALKKDTSTIRGAAKAYRESQTRIYKIEAPMYVGVGEGIDSLDFHADLSALKVILPDESHEHPLSSQPVPRSDSPLLHKLKQGETTYAHCAWCTIALPTRYKLEEHYYLAHHVVLQPSCCAPPSVFQTIMGKELQLRQKNFASFGITKLLLRHHRDPEEAKRSFRSYMLADGGQGESMVRQDARSQASYRRDAGYCHTGFALVSR